VDRIYVSFDVDALDSSICRGTGTPVPCGLWADEAEAILRRLLDDPLVPRSIGMTGSHCLAAFTALEGGQPPAASVRSATKTP
jgi:hypothetical protein